MKKLLALILAAVMFVTIVPPVNAEAATLNAGGTMRGATVIPAYKTNYYTKIKYANQTRWLKFKTKSYDGFYTINLKNVSYDGGLSFYLMNSAGEEFKSSSYNYKNNEVFWNLKLKKSTWYYIKLKSSSYDGVGNVKVNLKVRKDSESDYKSGAKTVSLRTTYIGHMDGEGDTDWFRFKAPTSGRYTFIMKNLSIDASVHFWVMNVYEEELASYNYMYKNNVGNPVISLSKGRYYYVKISCNSSKCGNYKIRIQKR